MDDFDFDVLTGPSGPAPKPRRERMPTEAPERPREAEAPPPSQASSNS
ncbi:MAG TPA: hypothetical protein VM689_12385 [Aliidongia sp.]|nr:hypothetical protein [Aliidongia sp.]